MISAGEEGEMQNDYAPGAVGVIRNSVFNKARMPLVIVVFHVEMHKQNVVVGVEIIRGSGGYAVRRACVR